MSRTARPALAGLLAAACGVAAGQLAAAAGRPATGPLLAVGSTVVDAAPTPVKEFAVATFGTADKPVLLAAVATGVALLAAGLGVAGARRRVAVPVGAAAAGALGAAAALTRPAAGWTDAAPSLLAAAVAAAALLLLLRRLPTTAALPPTTATGPTPPPVDAVTPGRAAGGAAGGGGARGGGAAEVEAAEDHVAGSRPAAAVDPAGPRNSAAAQVDRRAFLRAAALVAAGTAAVGGAAAAVGRVRGGAAARARAALRLPAPADPAPPLPPGLPPDFTTAPAALYRVDTALAVPRLDPATWTLRVHGMLDRPLELDLAALLRRPLVERHLLLTCVSNEVGGPYAGTGRWLGVPLAPLLRECGVRAGAEQVVARAADGMTIGTPLAAVLDGRDAMLAVGLDGAPLPPEHGFPVRVLTPGVYGYAGSAKWLTELEVTTFAAFDPYWVRRGWDRRGVVRTASRIDRPAPFARPAAGPVTVAGVAWAPRRGVAAVEVRVDDGPWRPAELLPVPSTDTWVSWRYAWAATRGPHRLAVRATDGAGVVQPQRRATPFPAGATGWHTVAVTVG